jgi:hypothetical protein
MEFLSKELVKELKQYSIGFPCIHKIENHYTEASYRLFLYTENGIVTLFWFEDKKKLVCKSQKFLDKLKSNDIIKGFL